MINSYATRACSNRAIKALKLVTPQLKIVSKNVQHLDHLAKYQNTVTILLQFRQQLIQKHHFSAASYQPFQLIFSTSAAIENAIFGIWKHIWMVTSFFEFHHDV